MNIIPPAPAAEQPQGEMVPRSDMQHLYNAYVRLLESGRDRIMDLGGQCDPVDAMERSDPYLIQARRTLASAAPSRPVVDGLRFTDAAIDAMQAKMADHGFAVPVRVVSDAYTAALGQQGDGNGK